MSRGLGPQQRRLLDYAGRYRGEPVSLVAEHLGVSERRARKVIESLFDRDELVVVNDPWTRDRRIWTPAAHWTWKCEQERADEQRKMVTLYPPIRTDAASNRPVELQGPSRSSLGTGQEGRSPVASGVFRRGGGDQTTPRSRYD